MNVATTEVATAPKINSFDRRKRLLLPQVERMTSFHDAGVVRSMVEVVGMSHYETREHVSRVATNLRNLVRRCIEKGAIFDWEEMGIAELVREHGQEGIDVAMLVVGLSHDIGKTDPGIRNIFTYEAPHIEVLGREHARLGADMIQSYEDCVRTDFARKILRLAKIGALTHHERSDGSGYPYGLREDEIALIGQLLGPTDVLDAVTHDRRYQKRLSKEEVIQIMIKLKGQKLACLPVCERNEYRVQLDAAGARIQYQIYE